jgi:hypothetical protein
MALTPKDETLLIQAREFSKYDWHKIGELREQAESEEAKERLRRLELFRYHQEEADAGII